MTVREMIDLPPVWLLGCLGVARSLDLLVPWSLFGPAGGRVGAVVVAIGVVLMLAAAAQMAAARTTLVPRREPAALVTGGVFRLSRNPIYLADTLILAGAILWWDVAHAAPLVFFFMALIQFRFILPEEMALRRRFGDSYDIWAARTGRWISPL
ncbi:MAG: isoprenylcysteine carboxylmethyltransferase family protein [Paracoccaceae bacterium]|nr:MAG: isoprenylcysteine carboxylmethyltransferase family protein [Paracoccaceae bacterium]